MLAGMMLIAAGLDVLENIGMLSMLRAGHVDSGVLPGLTTASAAIKFLPTGVISLAAVLALLFVRKR